MNEAAPESNNPTPDAPPEPVETHHEVHEGQRPDENNRTVRLDGEDMYRLLPDPEDFMHWSVRKRSYHFDADSGLWSEDPGEKIVAARLLEATRLRKVPHPSPKQPDRESYVHVDPSTINSGIGIARIKHAVKEPPWNEDDHLCGTPRGVLDLRTATIRPGRRDEFVLGRLGVTPQPGPHPVFTDFITFAFPDDHERAFVLAALASLLGGVRLERIFMIRGVSRSGKTKLIELMKHVTGSYGSTFPKGTVTRAKGEYPPSHRAWMLPLRHARWAVAPEIKTRHRIQAAELNDWSDGGWQRADSKGGGEEEWQSHIKPVLYGNEDPQLDANSGIVERLCRIEMDRVKPREQRDSQLKDKLEAEAPAIAHTLATAYADRIQPYLLQGQPFLPNTPARFEEAARRYLANSDDKLRFVQDCLDLTGNPEDRISAAQLFDMIKAWCEAESIPAPANTRASTAWIKSRLEDMNPRPHQHRTSNWRGWLGIRPKAPTVT